MTHTATKPLTHLAELNIARLRAPITDPLLADFVAALDVVNATAERSPGFVWRLKDDGGSAIGVDSPFDETMIVNMSVWESATDLEHYVWNTVHKRIYQMKAKWFDAMERHHFVMWDVPVGHRPTLEEAAARLAHLDAHGDTDHAYTWSHLPHVKLWQSQRCG